MKVYLRYSPRSDRKNGLLIYDTIEQLGHIHTSTFVKKLDPVAFYKQSQEEWKKGYVVSLKEMDEADVCVIETSIPSTAMGQLAQLAVDKVKPTILLYLRGQKPYFFRGLAETEKRVQLLEYGPENLKEVLEDAFVWAEEFINTRFTLLFPPDIVAHLNSLKKKGVPKSEYIRDLIREDMHDK